MSDLIQSSFIIINGKKLIAKKVENKIIKVQNRKIERIAKQEVEGKPVKAKKKMTPAQQKQIQKRVKRIKFAEKIKKIIS